MEKTVGIISTITRSILTLYHAEHLTFFVAFMWLKFIKTGQKLLSDITEDEVVPQNNIS